MPDTNYSLHVEVVNYNVSLYDSNFFPSDHIIVCYFRNSSSHTCPFLQQRQQQHHHPHHSRLYHSPTNSSVCPLSMGSTVPLQHHPPHPGPPVIIDVDQMPDHVRAVPVTSLPNSLLVASVPVAAPTYIQPHQPPVSDISKFRGRSSIIFQTAGWSRGVVELGEHYLPFSLPTFQKSPCNFF